VSLSIDLQLRPSPNRQVEKRYIKPVRVATGAETDLARSRAGTTPKIPAAPQLSNRIIELGVAAALRMGVRCATA